MVSWLVETCEGWSTLAVSMRLGLAALVGIVIGAERETHTTGAGIKTHVLVCVGSAMSMVVSEYIYHRFGAEAIDMSRIGAGVVSGVGFLGVGTIIVTGNNEIRGLTTAAGLWTCACVGLAAGMGYVQGTLVALAFILFTFVVLKRLDTRLRDASKMADLYLELDSNRNVKHLLHLLRRLDVRFFNLHVRKGPADGDGPIVTLTVRMDHMGELEQTIEALQELDYVYYVDSI